MKLSEVIRCCANVERLIGEVYERYAEQFPEDPVGAMWHELSLDERAHEARLWEIARLPVAERDDASFNPEQLEALRNRALQYLNRDVTTLDGAFATAMDLESLELENIYRRLFALTTCDSRMSSALRAALGEVGRHDQKIISAIQHHSMNPELRAIAAREHQAMLKHGAV